jgi:hypothetical protein
MKIIFVTAALVVLHFSSPGQKTFTAETPCTDVVLFKTPGRWFISYRGLLDNGSEYVPLTKAQVKETTKRMDAVHQLLLKIYPQPTGLDAAWHHTAGKGSFGEQVKYVRNSQGILNREPIKEKPVASFGHVIGFFRHNCNPHNSKEILPGYPGETGTWVGIHANVLGGEMSDGGITIDGYPLCLRQPLIKKFGDFELQGIVEATLRFSTGGIVRSVLVHRKGELPYIPVTRKQYLEKCIPVVTAFWDESVKAVEEQPVRSPAEQEAEKKATIAKMEKDHARNPSGMKAAIDYYLAGYKTEQQIRDENAKKIKQDKEAALKRYQEEWGKTANEGLLDAPAIVGFFCNRIPGQEPIFVDEKNGWMVVVQNPVYMRKDLPKWVPQFFVVTWRWDEWKPQADIAKMMEEKFPFEKLQAMIDK